MGIWGWVGGDVTGLSEKEVPLRFEPRVDPFEEKRHFSLFQVEEEPIDEDEVEGVWGKREAEGVGAKERDVGAVGVTFPVFCDEMGEKIDGGEMACLSAEGAGESADA